MRVDFVSRYGPWAVDVLAVPAGLTDTPAMRQSGIIGTDAGFVAMDPEDVVREALDALGVTGPLLVPGSSNREAAGSLWPVDRRQHIRSMTDGATALYGLPPLDDPTT